MEQQPTVKCYRCNQQTPPEKERLRAVMVEPIDGGGHGLLFAFLCEHCISWWDKTNRKLSSSTNDSGSHDLHSQPSGCGVLARCALGFSTEQGQPDYHHFVQVRKMVRATARSPAIPYPPPTGTPPYPNDMVTENFEKIAVCRLLRLTIY